MLIVAFTAPDPSADYSFSIADARTGNSFSTAAGGFSPAPADELVKMSRDLSPNRAAQRYGFVPATLDPPAPGQYLVYVHPSSGGQPVGPPFEIVAAPPRASGRSLNLALSL